MNILKNTHRFTTIFLLGFASGLPLLLTSSTLQAWLTVSGVNIITIGWFSLVGQPYIYKFLWSPLVDRLVPTFLDRRRAWMLIAQCALIVTLTTMAFMNPKKDIAMIGFVALLVAFCSTTQDIAYDAYRTDLLSAKERGLGSAVMLTGYRIAMLVSGAFALVIAKYYGWRVTYLLMATLMLIGAVASILGPKLTLTKPPATLWLAFVEPLKEFLSRRCVLAILLLIVLYKLGDAFVLSLSTTFLLRALHFTLVDIAIVNKVVGLLSILVGTFIAGLIMARIRFYSALMLFGLLQALTNLAYWVLALVGKNFVVMAIAIVIENIGSGMSTVAFLTLLMSLCDARYSATQFALFSALSAVIRVFIGPIAAIMVAQLGWAWFYFWTFVSGFPALAVLWYLKKRINFNLEHIM